MPLAKLGWNWPSGSGEEDFLKLSIYFYHFPIIFPSPSFEQTWSPFTRGYFVPNLVEIGPVVLNRKSFKSYQFIFIISRFCPLWEGRSPLFLKNTWVPFTKGYFVPSLVEIGLEENVNRLQTDRQTDDGRRWSEKLTWAFSSDELNQTKKRTWQQKGKKWARRRFEYALYCFRIAFLSGK